MRWREEAATHKLLLLQQVMSLQQMMPLHGSVRRPHEMLHVCLERVGRHLLLQLLQLLQLRQLRQSAVTLRGALGPHRWIAARSRETCCCSPPSVAAALRAHCAALLTRCRQHSSHVCCCCCSSSSRKHPVR